MEGGSCIVFFTHVARSAGEMARKKTIKTRSSQLADLKNGVVVVRTAMNIAKVSQRTASPRTRIGSTISESLALLFLTKIQCLKPIMQEPPSIFKLTTERM